jgi:hypothetical protein
MLRIHTAVSGPVDFCVAPSPTSQNFGSGSSPAHFPHILKEEDLGFQKF